MVLQNKILACLIMFHFTGMGQKNDTSLYRLKVAEAELMLLQKPTFYSRVENERLEGNKQFLAVWDRIIDNPKILEYGFDSLKDISVLRPSDHKFTLITWNIPRDDGSHVFFGYLLVNNSKRIKTGFLRHKTIEAYESFKLLDRSMTIKSPEMHVGGPDKWFGMLYTQLIASGDCYTLIGWDGNNKLTTRKFVDVLWFKPDGTPVFGKDIFKLNRKNPRRLMFEYSADVTMSLKYDEKKNQIVYNHLSAKQEGLLEGQYQFYGPDGSFDALEWIKNRWVVNEDIDAHFERGKNDSYPENSKPKPEKQKAIYKPKK